MLGHIIEEIEGCKFLTVEDAKRLAKQAYDAGVVDGRLKELHRQNEEIERLRNRLIDELDRITVE
jgi:phage terminase large subunit-like protein